MPVSYIICAAGLGSRTQAINTSIAKPLLKLQGESLLQRSLQSLPIEAEDQVIILHSESMKSNAVHKSLGQIPKTTSVLTIEISLTRGQLETALLALPSIPLKNSVAVFNSDTYFRADDLATLIKNSSWDGLIPSSEEPGESWSFCRTEWSPGPCLKVIEVQEKKRISSWCSVGFYWFKSKELFKEFGELEMTRVDALSEIYVAPMYNAMIEKGFQIGMLPCQVFKPMGSLDQLLKYWDMTLETMVKENR